MDFVFEQLRIGGDRNFGYLLGDRDAKTCVLIDPAYSPEMLVERAQAQGLRPAFILNTHGHGDHINGNAKARELTGAPIAGFRGSAAIKPEHPLGDGETLTIGRFVLRMLHTPGHADDHLVIYCEETHVAVSGDLLFVGKVGGTKGDEAARLEWQSLQRVLEEMPDATTVWPGHDYGARPASTIGLEKRTNPFLRCQDVDAFIRLKAEWAHYKQAHGLR